MELVQPPPVPSREHFLERRLAAIARPELSKICLGGLLIRTGISKPGISTKEPHSADPSLVKDLLMRKSGDQNRRVVVNQSVSLSIEVSHLGGRNVKGLTVDTSELRSCLQAVMLLNQALIGALFNLP